MKQKKAEHCPRNHDKKHRLLATHHRASGRTRRRYKVPRVSALLQFPDGRPCESVNQAKVFRAHAVPQGVCGNLINALKLLANQQEDGDGLVQNIVTNLGEMSRRGLTQGLKELINIDNQRALEVGDLSQGVGKFKVRRPKVPEGCPEGDGQGEPR